MIFDNKTLRLSRRSIVQTGLILTATLPVMRPRLAAAAYVESGVVDGGRMAGFVRFDGELPPLDRILISKDGHVCGEGHAIPDSAEVGDDGSLAGAVVALNDVGEGKPWPDEMKAPEIVQEACKFQPYVQVAPKGAELTITNKDPLLHNIHAYEIIGRARRTMFNIAQPQADQVDKHVLKMKRGDVVELDCDAHNWMSAWVYTADHPYVAVTDASGAFLIEDVPEGEFEVTIWHPLLGSLDDKVRVASGQDTAIDFTLQASDV